MVSVGKTVDGTLESILNASNELKTLPSFLHGFVSLGDNKLNIKKDVDLQDYIAQVSALDATQQSAALSLTKFTKEQKEAIKETVEQIKAGKLLNSVIVETELKTKGISSNLIQDLLRKSGLKNNDIYSLLPSSNAFVEIQKYIDALADEGRIQELVNAEIIEGTAGNYKLSQSFIDLLTKRSADTSLTWGQKFAQDALNVSLQLGKQLLLSLGVAAVSFVVSGIVDYVRNLKTETEKLVGAMDDAQTKLQDATDDVEEIEGKIEELNKCFHYSTFSCAPVQIPLFLSSL